MCESIYSNLSNNNGRHNSAKTDVECGRVSKDAVVSKAIAEQAHEQDNLPNFNPVKFAWLLPEWPTFRAGTNAYSSDFVV